MYIHSLKVISLLFFLFATNSINAQYVEKEKRMQTPTDTIPVVKQNQQPKSNFDWSKLAPGGNFALSFGNPTNILIAPAVGYRVTDKFIPGVGITYMYSRVNYGNTIYQSHTYGGRAYLQYMLISNIFVYGEYQALNGQIFNNTTEVLERKWIYSPFVGAGLRVPVGSRSGITIMALYNLNYSQATSIYNSPWSFRVGFTL